MGLGMLSALMGGKGGSRERRKGAFDGVNVLLASYERLTGYDPCSVRDVSMEVFVSFVSAWKKLKLDNYSDEVAGMGLLLYHELGNDRASEALNVLNVTKAREKNGDGGRVSDEWVLMCYLSSEMGYDHALGCFHKLFGREGYVHGVVGKVEEKEKEKVEVRELRECDARMIEKTKEDEEEDE